MIFSDILTSASKIVFILIAFVLCVAFLFEVMTGKIIFETKDFIPLAVMAFTYYFAYKPQNTPTPPADQNQAATAIK